MDVLQQCFASTVGLRVAARVAGAKHTRCDAPYATGRDAISTRGMFATERTRSRQRIPRGGGVAVALGREQFRGRDMEPPLGAGRREAWSGRGVRGHYRAEESATSS